MLVEQGSILFLQFEERNDDVVVEQILRVVYIDPQRGSSVSSTTRLQVSNYRPD